MNNTDKIEMKFVGTSNRLCELSYLMLQSRLGSDTLSTLTTLPLCEELCILGGL